MKSASALYRLLGDEARLRLLRVLSRERLNVTELTRILGLAQSGVSRHLGLLKDAGLVVEERAGGFTYYRTAPQGTPLWALLDAQFAAAAADRVGRADEARLQEVLRLRKESFEAHGDERGQLVPGRSWAAWARALGLLLPSWRVVDLGCGEGYLTIEAARWAKAVIAVDRSEAVLRQARALARRRGVTNITWKHGELERVPIRDVTVDVALLSQALHHAADPARALAEAVRIVAPPPSTEFKSNKPLVYASSGVLVFVWLISTFLFFFGDVKWTYLCITLFWALPAILPQFLFGADILWYYRKLVFWGIFVPGAYLSLMDIVALKDTTWAISPSQTTGILFFGILPLEEVVFFFITNMLIVFGTTLLLANVSDGRFAEIKKQFGRGKRRDFVTGDVDEIVDPLYGKDIV